MLWPSATFSSRNSFLIAKSCLLRNPRKTKDVSHSESNMKRFVNVSHSSFNSTRHVRSRFFHLLRLTLRQLTSIRTSNEILFLSEVSRHKLNQALVNLVRFICSVYSPSPEIPHSFGILWSYVKSIVILSYRFR